MKKKILTILLTLFTLRVVAFQTYEHSIPISVEDILNIPAFPDLVPISISPDGKLLAYTLQTNQERNPTSFFNKRGTPTDHSETGVYVVNTTNGISQKLIEQSGSSWGGAWSPDGRYLAFYSDHDSIAKAWVWDSKANVLKKLSDSAVRPFWGFEQMAWSPDGKRILIKLVPEGKSFDDMNALYPAQLSQGGILSDSTVRVYSTNLNQKEDPLTQVPHNLSPEASFLNIELGDLVLVDIQQMKSEKIESELSVLSYRFSNNGQKIAYVARSPDDGKGFPFDKYDIWIHEIGKESKKVATRVIQSYGQGLSWSPDDNHIAFTDDNTVRILAVSSDSTVRSFQDDDLGLVKDFRPPLWANDKSLVTISRNTLWRLSLPTGEISPIAVSDDDRLLEFAIRFETQKLKSDDVLVLTRNRNTKEMGFKSIDLNSGQLEQRYIEKAGITTDPSVELSASADGNLISFISESSTSPPEVWIADRTFKQPRQLTSIHKGLGKYEFGSTQLISWEMENGKMLSGTLILPSNYHPKNVYPLIVKVYGGARPSNSIYRFGVNSGIDNLQLLASRGYAVLLPDMPISSGSPMKQIGEIASAATKKVVSMGIVDPDRIAVFGHSYGGYSALSVAVQSDQFKTVISSAGMSNLTTRYGGMHQDGTSPFVEWSEFGQGRLGGSPWEFTERYIENSPFFYLDDLNASALLIHGGIDNTVFASAAKETFVGLRRLNKRAKLVIFEGEDHHPETWSAENAVEFWKLIFDWLDYEL